MKKLKRFTSKMEAHLAHEYLKSNGIHSEVIGTREYTSHLLGTDKGSFELLVAEETWAMAYESLKKIEQGNEEPTKASSRTYFRKAVMFSFAAAFMLPVLFNFAALRNLRLFLETENHSVKKWVGAIAVVLLQIPTVLVLYFIIDAMRKY
ncbi:MAG: hypothetical protein AB7O96_13130 [Pseudobdellovibrionaceae bacterium]